MSEVIKSEAVELERTADVIAGEILAIKQQVEMVALAGAVEIGRRLCEAKEMVGHGAWLEFLSEKVGFSTSKANNMMRIFNEFGSQQTDLLQGNKSDLEVFSKLSVSQAVALFALPPAERAEFTEENDIENKSVREIQQLIKERDEALNAKTKTEGELAKQSEKIQKLSKSADDAKKYKDELSKIKSEVSTAEQAKKEAEEKSEQLRERIKELEAAPIEVGGAVIPSDEELEAARQEERSKLEAELLQARESVQLAEKRVQAAKNPLVTRVAFLFEEFNSRYEQMTAALGQLNNEQPDTAANFLAAIADALTDMQTSLAL